MCQILSKLFSQFFENMSESTKHEQYLSMLHQIIFLDSSCERHSGTAQWQDPQNDRVSILEV